MQELILGGRQFKVIDFDRRTVLQDHYLQKHLRLIGADKVFPMDGEDNAAYLVRLQVHILDSGRAPDLIGGYLLPIDKTETDFTPRMADEIAAHISKCHEQVDRETVIDLASQVAFGFFRQGLEQWRRSLVSLLSTSPNGNPGETASDVSIPANTLTSFEK